MMLLHRSCSNCHYWGDLKEPVNGLIAAICEKSAESKIGSDKCSKWKKLNYVYNPMYDRMEKSK